MNVNVWKNNYKNKPGYRECMVKNMHAFILEFPSFKRTIFYPRPLIASVKKRIQDVQFQLVHYELMETASSSSAVSRDENLTIRVSIKETVFACTLSIHHDKGQTVTLYVGETEEERILSLLYKEMILFIEQYSPYRLELVTNQYTYKIPAWKDEKIES